MTQEHITSVAAAKGVNDIVGTLETSNTQCLDSVQALRDDCTNLRSGVYPSMGKSPVSSLKVLASLERHVGTTHDAVTEAHRRTPYTRDIDRLSDDILSMILVTASGSGQGTLRLHHRGPRLYFPERAVQVSRRWRTVGEGTALAWTSIRVDHNHSPDRISRWLTLSGGAPLSVVWRPSSTPHLQTAWVKLITPHLLRIRTLDLTLPNHNATVVKQILAPLASSTTLESVTLCSATEGAATLRHITSSTAFPSLRTFQMFRMGLHWTWPIRNLRVLQLQCNDEEFDGDCLTCRQFLDVLASSPHLETLSLDSFNLSLKKDEEEVIKAVVLPSFVQLTTLEVRNGGIGFTSILVYQLIKAPSLVKLAFKNILYGSEGVAALIAGAALTIKDVSVDNIDVVDDVVTTVVSAEPRRLNRLTVTGWALDYPKVSDENLEALVCLPGLTTLKLFRIRFSEEKLLESVLGEDEDGGASSLEVFETDQDLSRDVVERLEEGIDIVCGSNHRWW